MIHLFKKEKNWVLLKLKTFFSAKNIKRMKEQPKDWEKMFTNHISDRDLSVEYIKVFQISTVRKPTT